MIHKSNTLHSKQTTPRKGIAVEMHYNNKTRLWILGGVMGCLFMILGAGLFYRQIILNKKYLKQEESQSLRRIVQPGPRGNIYDRKGRLLVGNRACFSVVLYLGELRDEFRQEYMRTVKQLRSENKKIKRDYVRREVRLRVVQRYLDQVNALLGRQETLSSKRVEQHFQQRLLLPITLVDNLEPHEFACLVEQLPVKSPLQLYTDAVRYYPYESLASHVLGYVVTSREVSSEGVPGEDLATFHFQGKVGKAGLEKSFDDALQGLSGGEVWRVDPSGFQYALVHQRMPMQGNSLVTSLDIDLQQVAEKALGKMKGAVVAIEIATGEVLAMVSKPDYNLSDLSPYIPQSVYDAIEAKGGWINRAIQGLYPPGSPFKILTAIAALRAGVMQHDVAFHCDGFLQVGNRKFPCLRRSGHGDLGLEKAISVSCNPLFYHYALEAGIARMSEESKRFGLGSVTGIELPFESRSTLVPTHEWKMKRGLGGWLGGDTANMAIGQGYLLVTPLQMACFMAAFAKKQTRIQPTLLHRAYYNQADHPESEPIGLSDEAYATIVRGMEQAAEYGTAKKAKVPGIRVAGKTGTAQVRVKNNPIDVVWFLGYAPIEEPKIAIAVIVEEASEEDNFWGGTTAAPIAGDIFWKYFNPK